MMTTCQRSSLFPAKCPRATSSFPRSVAAGAALLLATAMTERAHAKPVGPQVFCESRPALPACSGRVPSCIMCHATPPALNPFGAALAPLVAGAYEQKLGDAVKAVAEKDSDGDGVANLAELEQGTLPGLAESVWRALSPVGTNPVYGIGKYDPAFAFRRLNAAFCGVSPSYEDMRALAAAPDARAFLHARVDQCLASEQWRGELLPRLADKRIRPLGAAGSCANFYGNFEYDYNLFVYALTEDHDARDLLVAQYHVERDGNGRLVKIDEAARPGAIKPPVRRAGIACQDRYGNTPPLVGGQTLPSRHRAGMVTTQWFLWKNTMGSYLPRQTAAQAYRSYLGYDLSLQEGIFPVAREPRDIDRRGTTSSPCYQCHSTLDPLAYAFAYYWGGAGGEATGTYMATRPTIYNVAPSEVRMDWLRNPPVAHLFGQPLPPETEGPALLAWARRAADSDAFKRHLATTFFVYSIGREPVGPDFREIDPIWRALPADGHSVNRLLHRLVDTLAFGAP